MTSDKRKRLTPKQRVLKKCPDAYAERSAFTVDFWYVWRDVNDAVLGQGYSALEAWADAARRLK